MHLHDSAQLFTSPLHIMASPTTPHTVASTEDKFALEIDLCRQQIAAYRERGLSLFASSSFQSHSIPMLHMLRQIDADIPVYFLQTGYHFPETLTFRNQVAKLLDLEVVSVSSPVSHSEQCTQGGRMLFTVDPDRCCHFNKVLSMQQALVEHDVWINGVRADQSAVRSGFNYEEQTAEGKLRYHPMIQWSQDMIEHYCEKHSLPKHPLHYENYVSIGCEPCTRRVDEYESYDERDGRWQGLHKTECGLHTEMIKK